MEMKSVFSHWLSVPAQKIEETRFELFLIVQTEYVRFITILPRGRT